MISLKPPDEPSLKLDTLIFHPFSSQYFTYIRYRSPAKRAASSPPVPPRISTIAFLSSCGSAGTSNNFISSSKAGIRSLQVSSSSRAISRISGSCSDSSKAFASSIPFNTFTYSERAPTIFSKSRYSLFSFTNRFMSAITAGSVIRVPTSSKRLTNPSNLPSKLFSAIYLY